MLLLYLRQISLLLLFNINRSVEQLLSRVSFDNKKICYNPLTDSREYIRHYKSKERQCDTITYRAV